MFTFDSLIHIVTFDHFDCSNITFDYLECYNLSFELFDYSNNVESLALFTFSIVYIHRSGTSFVLNNRSIIQVIEMLTLDHFKSN